MKETSYFDSLKPHGDNQDYVERLQQDIRHLREEYAAARKSREDFLARNRAQDTWMEEYRNKDQEERQDWKVEPVMRKRESRNKTDNRDVENLVRRSFWSDLTNIKVKLSKKSSWSSKVRGEESERESWYRTSRRFTDSRHRRSIRKKPRERLSTSYKDGGKLPKKQTRAFNSNADRRGPVETRKVYDEILDIVNVNSPNTLPFGKDRMAHWLLTSRTSPSV